MTDSLTEWLWYQDACDAAVYSAEADRLYFMSDPPFGDLCAFQGQTQKLCWVIYDNFDERPWNLCADTARGKLYCGSWPMGVSVVDLSKRMVTASLSPGSMEDEPVAGCVNALLGKNYILMEDGGIMVFDAVADTVMAGLSLDSTLKWSLIACAVAAERVLCTARSTGLGVLIDCSADSVAGPVRLGKPARAVEVGLDRTTFTVATSGYLYVVEAGTGAILDSASIGPTPSALCYAPAMQKLYCADTNDRCLYVLSTSSDSVVGRVELDGKPYGLCYDSADSKLYVACTEDDVVWVVDCASDKTATCIRMAASSRQSPPVYSTFGNRVYFMSDDSLGVIECCQDKVSAWLHGNWSWWGDPCPPCVFPTLHLVTVMGDFGPIAIIDDPPARPVVTSAAQGRAPTVTRGTLHAGFGPSRLFDLSGRKVLDLLPGWNDVSELSPGIYFSREQTADGSEQVKTRKVVVLR